MGILLGNHAATSHDIYAASPYLHSWSICFPSLHTLSQARSECCMRSLAMSNLDMNMPIRVCQIWQDCRLNKLPHINKTHLRSEPVWRFAIKPLH